MKNSKLKQNRIVLLIFITSVALLSFEFCTDKVEYACPPVPMGIGGTQSTKVETNKDSIIVELKKTLDDEFKLFYPVSIDTVYGGYYSDLNYKWELEGRQNKMIVTQARHVWSNANAALFYPDKSSFLKTALHGFKFLKDVMWDKQYGGFYNLVTKQGKPLKENGAIIKQAYGDAFAIYGLAAYYKAFGDTSALNLAKETFNWLEKHSYDPKFGGYFQFMAEDGTPYKDGYRNIPPKDQNSMIHILESFTELYGVWPDALLKDRLTSLLDLVRDTVIGNKGYMTLFFKRDWTPISYKDSSDSIRRRNFEFDYISFGHDVETAYLMLEASHAIGIKNDTLTLRIGKELDDFALKYGWDTTNGGIYDGGYIFKGNDKVTIVRKTKEWWNQVEACNSFLMMSKLFPGEKLNYYEKFCVQWEYIKKYLIDHQYGGFYWGGIDKAPRVNFAPKSTIWKCNYHTSRGLINCILRLEDKI